MDLTYLQAMDLIASPKVILETNGQVCTQKSLGPSVEGYGV